MPSQRVGQLLDGDVSFFEGPSATQATGWLRHPEIYLEEWLDDIDARRPRRFARTLLLGMGGSSSPARFYADWRPEGDLQVIDTSHLDTIADIDFREVTVIAASKSGVTLETQTLLAHALASGLDPQDLVIITDPGTALGALGELLGALVVKGDPLSGGRFSALSPFGLIPALYAGWRPDEIRHDLAGCFLTDDLVVRAEEDAAHLARSLHGGVGTFALGADPISSGGSLWLEQLIAETTGKSRRGFIPLVQGPVALYHPGDIQYYHLLAAFLAWHVGVNPFDQPSVDGAKQEVFAQLSSSVPWVADAHDSDNMQQVLRSSSYIALQAFAPLSASSQLASLRVAVENAYGPTMANLGPRYLHSTGQLHKGGPATVVGVQIIQRPRSQPQRIEGRAYSFHDLHMAQANGDARAMRGAGHRVFQLMVDNLSDAADDLGLGLGS